MSDRIARPLSRRLLYLCRPTRHATRQTSTLITARSQLPQGPRRHPCCTESLRRPNGQVESSRLPRPSPVRIQPFATTSPPRSKIIVNPRTDDDGKEMSIEILPRASHRLASIMEKDNNPSLCLRVSVESGGCHGFQYIMSLMNRQDVDAAEDTVFESDDGKGARVVMDGESLGLLNGSKIDYTMELIGSQFKVTGIPGATSSCGCGTSFDVKI